jgi:hypothetical protein
MLNINVNGVQYKSERGLTILQFCLSNGINIPSFCYHERLNIAGNCRMCLVEVKGLPKPIESCTMLLQDNMSIFTETPFVKKAQENILESVLFMHPLDCPICDQGGECDLQDQAFQYGADRGRFYGARRLVFDKNCGFFIKTVMTRCIHCTRCVRFSAEICNSPYFGTLKRGSSTEIAYYKVKPFRSELSGNVIDLCPVGALTSKPHAFIGRPWEDSFESESFDILDPLGSSISVLSTNTKLIKIIPRIENNVNKEWISDRIRFSYDSLEHNRLLVSYKKKGYSYKKKNLYTLKKKISSGMFKLSSNYFSNTSVDFSFFYALYSLSLTSNYFKNFSFYRNLFFYRSNLYSNLDFRSNFIDFFFLDSLNNYDSFFFFNLSLKQEYPIFNSYLNMYSKKNSSNVFCYGNPIYFNLNIQHIGSNFKSIVSFFKGNHLFSKNLYDSHSVLYLGQNILNTSYYFKDNILFKGFYNYLELISNSFYFNKRLFNLNFFNLFTSLQDSSLVEIGYIYNTEKLIKNQNNFSLNLFFFSISVLFIGFSSFKNQYFFKKTINFFDSYHNLSSSSFFSNNSKLYFTTHGFSFKNQEFSPKYILPLSSFFERPSENIFMYYGYLGKKTVKHFLNSSFVHSELYYLNLFFNKIFSTKNNKKKLTSKKFTDFKINFSFNIKDLRLNNCLSSKLSLYGLNNKNSFYTQENLIVHSKNLTKAKDLFLKIPFSL